MLFLMSPSAKDISARLSICRALEKSCAEAALAGMTPGVMIRNRKPVSSIVRIAVSIGWNQYAKLEKSLILNITENRYFEGAGQGVQSVKKFFVNLYKGIYLFEIKRVRRITSFSGNELATVLIAVVCIALLVWETLTVQRYEKYSD